MTYEDSGSLMTDIPFHNRIKVAALTFANYVMNEPTSVAAHTSRVKWAQRCYQQPDLVASELQPPTVMEPQVQAGGAAVSDSDLQTAVETVIQQML